MERLDFEDDDIDSSLISQSVAECKKIDQKTDNAKSFSEEKSAPALAPISVVSDIISESVFDGNSPDIIYSIGKELDSKRLLRNSLVSTPGHEFSRDFALCNDLRPFLQNVLGGLSISLRNYRNTSLDQYTNLLDHSALVAIQPLVRTQLPITSNDTTYHPSSIDHNFLFVSHAGKEDSDALDIRERHMLVAYTLTGHPMVPITRVPRKGRYLLCDEFNFHRRSFLFNTAYGLLEDGVLNENGTTGSLVGHQGGIIEGTRMMVHVCPIIPSIHGELIPANISNVSSQINEDIRRLSLSHCVAGRSWGLIEWSEKCNISMSLVGMRSKIVRYYNQSYSIYSQFQCPANDMSQGPSHLWGKLIPMGTGDPIPGVLGGDLVRPFVRTLSVDTAKHDVLNSITIIQSPLFRAPLVLKRRSFLPGGDTLQSSQRNGDGNVFYLLVRIGDEPPFQTHRSGDSRESIGHITDHGTHTEAIRLYIRPLTHIYLAGQMEPLIPLCAPDYRSLMNSIQLRMVTEAILVQVLKNRGIDEVEMTEILKSNLNIFFQSFDLILSKIENRSVDGSTLVSLVELLSGIYQETSPGFKSAISRYLPIADHIAKKAVDSLMQCDAQVGQQQKGNTNKTEKCHTSIESTISLELLFKDGLTPEGMSQLYSILNGLAILSENGVHRLHSHYRVRHILKDLERHEHTISSYIRYRDRFLLPAPGSAVDNPTNTSPLACRKIAMSRTLVQALIIERLLALTPWSLSTTYINSIVKSRRGWFITVSAFPTENIPYSEDSVSIDPKARGEAFVYIRSWNLLNTGVAMSQDHIYQDLSYGNNSPNNTDSQLLDKKWTDFSKKDLRTRKKIDLVNQMVGYGFRRDECERHGRWELARQLSILTTEEPINKDSASSSSVYRMTHGVQNRRPAIMGILASYWKKHILYLIQAVTNLQPRKLNSINATSHQNELDGCSLDEIPGQKSRVSISETRVSGERHIPNHCAVGVSPSIKTEEGGPRASHRTNKRHKIENSDKVPIMVIITSGRVSHNGIPYNKIQYACGQRNIDVYKKWKLISPLGDKVITSLIKTLKSVTIFPSLEIHRSLKLLIEKNSDIQKIITSCALCGLYGHERGDAKKCHGVIPS